MTGAVQGVTPANMEAVGKISGPNAAGSRPGTNSFAITSDDMKEATVRKPFVGAKYERNWPTKFPAQVEGLPVRVTILNNSTAPWLGSEPCVLVLMPWDFPWPAPEWRTSDEVRLPLEQFLSDYHPIDNVIRLQMPTS